MKPEGRIGPHAAVVAASLLPSMYILFAPSIAADYGLSAAWLVQLAAGLFALALSLFPDRLMSRFKGRTIIEVGYLLLGGFGGFAAGLLIFVFFLIDTALDLRIVADRITTVYLPSTPLSVVMLTMALTGLWGAYLGIETISRSILVGYRIMLLSVIIPVGLSAIFWNVGNFFPLLGTGPVNIAKGGAAMAGMFSEMVVLLAIIYPAIKTRPKDTGIITRSALWAAVFLFIATIGVQLVFPAPILNENLFPLVEVSRLVFLSRFVQRIDAITTFIWISGMLFKYTLLLIAALYSLTQLLRLPYYRPFLLPVSIIVFALANLPHNIIQSHNLASKFGWPIGLVIGFALPGFLLLVAHLRPGVKKSEAA